MLQEWNTDPEILQAALETINELRDEVRRDLELLRQKTALYEQQRQVIEKRDNLSSGNRRLRDEELRLVNQLLTELNRRISQVQGAERTGRPNPDGARSSLSGAPASGFIHPQALSPARRRLGNNSKAWRPCHKCCGIRCS